MTSNSQIKPYSIVVLNINRKGAPQFLAKRIEEGLRKDISSFKIKIPPDAHAAYPSMCVPIAGVIDHYRRTAKCEFLSSTSLQSNKYLTRTSFMKPRLYDKQLIANHATFSFLDTVWRFTEEDQYEIVSGIIHSIRSKIVAKPGVIESIELCLNEITDNVLVHSSPSGSNEKPAGFVMAQCHPGDSNIAIAVYDNGQGIYRSFMGSSHKPYSPEEAIRLALTRNVTSGAGQGRGMWMLSSIVEWGKGFIEVNSGGARFLHEHQGKHEKAPVTSKVSKEIEGTTLVDFRLSATQEIDIARALQGHEPTNLWMENHEDEKEHIHFYIKEESGGTGTRYAGKIFRHIVENTANQTNRKIILDFTDVNIVSSSYADELIGELLDKFGFISFNVRFALIGVTPLNAMIIEEAIKTRYLEDAETFAENAKNPT